MFKHPEHNPFADTHRHLLPSERINPLFQLNPKSYEGWWRTGRRFLSTPNATDGHPHPSKSWSPGPKGIYALRVPWWLETDFYLQHIHLEVDLSGLGAAQWLPVGERINKNDITSSFLPLTGELTGTILESLQGVKDVLVHHHRADPKSQLAELPVRADHWLAMTTDYKDWRWREDTVVERRRLPMRQVCDLDVEREPQSEHDAAPKSHLNRCDPLNTPTLTQQDADKCYGQVDVLIEQVTYIASLAQAIMEIEVALCTVPIKQEFHHATAVLEQTDKTKVGTVARYHRLHPSAPPDPQAPTPHPTVEIPATIATPPTAVPTAGGQGGILSYFRGWQAPTGPLAFVSALSPLQTDTDFLQEPAPSPFIPPPAVYGALQPPPPVNRHLPTVPKVAWDSTPKVSHFLEPFEVPGPDDGEPDEYGRRVRAAFPITKQECEYSRREFAAYRLILVELIRVRGGQLYHNLIETSHDQAMFNSVFEWKTAIDRIVEPYLLQLAYLSYDEAKLKPIYREV